METATQPRLMGRFCSTWSFIGWALMAKEKTLAAASAWISSSRSPMNAALNMTDERYASFYDELCNVIARVEFNISDEDPYSHTSDAARAGANRILGVLNEVGF